MAEYYACSVIEPIVDSRSFKLVFIEQIDQLFKIEVISTSESSDSDT